MRVNRFLIVIGVLISFACKAQLDTLHYFAPLHIYQNPLLNTHHVITVSTSSITPINYTIERADGTLISSGTVQKSTPVEVPLGMNNTTNSTDLFVSTAELNTVLSGKGVVIRSDSPGVTASLRSVSLNGNNNADQAELVNSRGQFAVGTTFRVAGVPNTSGGLYRAASFGVLALESNTQITISGWSNGMILNGTPTVSPTTTTSYTLNQGESIVFSMLNNTTANLDGFLGLEVTSSNRIVMSNGLIHGNVVGNIQAQDILVEQTVPVNQLGTSYIAIRGEETNTYERVYVTAHSNNTAITLNGGASPFATINAGEYIEIPASFYTNGNMFIETSEPAYCYKHFSGIWDNGKATSIVLIPPLGSNMLSEVLGNYSLNSFPGYSFTSNLAAVVGVNDTLWVADNSGSTTYLPNSGTTVGGNAGYITHKVSGISGNYDVRSSGDLILTQYGGGHHGGYASSFGRFSQSTCSNTLLSDTTCIGGLYQLSFSSASPDTGYYTDFGQAQVVSGTGTGPYELSFSSIGDYEVLYIESTTQCPDTHRVRIHVIDEYQPSFTQVGDSELCPDESVWFYVDSNQAHLSITWFDGGGGYSRQVSNSGDVWYLAQGLCGTYSDTVSVSAIPVPEFTTFNDTLLCGTEELMVEINDPENHYAYQWADGYIGADRLIDSSGVYELLASNDCGTFSSGPLTIDFGTCHCHVWIPNAFTPNGNRLNEGFGVEYDCSLETFEMEIYNRWGQKLYHTFSADDKWDGRYAGEMSATGVYLYIITYTYRNDYGSLVRESKEGSLTLLR